ncbi:MAG: YjbE family putative metal transport protein [Pseudorhodoplanes sp.]|nr:YjbE family putative metal transport protein [Pseudorhodoplanes sp.]
MIDFVLAGDNAIVVGMAAARVDPKIRARVIVLGIAGAVILRILFATVATQLLAIVGLTFAGGILLLWVCWKMYREIAFAHPQTEHAFAGVPGEAGGSGPDARTLGFGAAITQIVVADVSMSLDNVLAVAGAAKGEIWVLAVGLTIAIVFMALLSAYIAGLLAKYPWISWVGLAIIVYVALEMIWTGSHQIGCQFVPASTCQAGAIPTFTALLQNGGA